MIRRVAAVLVALTLATVPRSSAGQEHVHSASMAKPALPAAPAAPGPAVLENCSSASGTVEVSLTAVRTRLSLQPGTTTEVYAYNGQIPGPRLEVREGDRVVVRFRNELPEATTVHWHGLHLPFEADGSPFHPVQPGEEYEYAFTVRPGAAGTYWYHPHPNHETGIQVARGLYGAVIVRAADDPLPASLAEQVLILSDNRFLPDGSVRHSRPALTAGPDRLREWARGRSAVRQRADHAHACDSERRGAALADHQRFRRPVLPAVAAGPQAPARRK